MPVDGRAGLPAVLLHGEPLVVHASRALTTAGVRLVAPATPWASVQEMRLPVVLHDPLCPLTPPAFIASLVRQAVSSGAIQVGVRPVTDTIKTVAGGVVGETVDRSSLLVVTSPVVLPPLVAGELDLSGPGGSGAGGSCLDDFGALVTRLRERFAVGMVEAPSVGRRVGDATDVLLLEAFEELDSP